MKKRILAATLSIVILVGILTAFWIGGLIMGDNKTDNILKTTEIDYLIVLGCDTEKSFMTERINAAWEFLKENPDTKVVCAGGIGEGKTVSEADGMAKMLIKKGVSPDRIIKEEKSKSTYENLLFAKELMDKKEGGEYSVAFVTNDFHVYRARKTAESLGLEKPLSISAKSTTPWYYLSFIREICAVAYYEVKYY